MATLFFKCFTDILGSLKLSFLFSMTFFGSDCYYFKKIHVNNWDCVRDCVIKLSLASSGFWNPFLNNNINILREKLSRVYTENIKYNRLAGNILHYLGRGLRPKYLLNRTFPKIQSKLVSLLGQFQPVLLFFLIDTGFPLI